MESIKSTRDSNIFEMDKEIVKLIAKRMKLASGRKEERREIDGELRYLLMVADKLGLREDFANAIIYPILAYENYSLKREG